MTSLSIDKLIRNNLPQYINMKIMVTQIFIKNSRNTKRKAQPFIKSRKPCSFIHENPMSFMTAFHGVIYVRVLHIKYYKNNIWNNTETQIALKAYELCRQYFRICSFFVIIFQCKSSAFVIALYWKLIFEKTKIPRKTNFIFID